MKVSGPGSNTPVNLRRSEKKGGAGSGDSTFNVSDSAGDGDAAPITGGQQMSPVASLIALQEVGTASDGRSKGLGRGRDILDLLEQVRLGLLLGKVPESQIRRLITALESRKQSFGDPELDQILKEIETRAAVELAKFDRIRAQNQ